VVIGYRKTNLILYLLLVYFVKIYMFRSYLGPSSGGKTVCVQQLMLIILFLDDCLLSWLDFSIQPEKERVI